MNPYDSASELGLHPLPADVVALLNQHRAPHRLAAHLIVVHHTALQLLSGIRTVFPQVIFDAYIVEMGAALHDVGKLVYPSELVTSGRQHEEAGYELLIKAGIDADIARFARTHGGRKSETNLGLEDLLVTLADAVWKGERDRSVEDMFVRRVSQQLHRPSWEIFSELDTLLTELTERSARLLAWQSLFPTD